MVQLLSYNQESMRKCFSMKRFIMMLSLLGGYAYNIQADEIDNPTVNSRLASSAQFTEENSFNGNGKGNPSNPKPNKRESNL